MKPISLQVQGLTSYKHEVKIDFSDLDLFAITGPTGAGKSSLVDAMAYALFGQAPRVGRNIRELISQGEERLKVSLEFSSNGHRYRIFRSTAKKGQTPVQLERLDAASGQWLAEEDRAEKATEHVQRLLGMDYEGFVRSVLLPQGQFQQFLAGKPEERRKVLDGLLRLEVYSRMHERASQMARSNEEEADRIRALLASQFADATAEHLKEAKQRLRELKGRTQLLAAVRQSLTEACRQADQLASARESQKQATERLRQVAADLKKAKEEAATARMQFEDLEQRLAAVERAIVENKYDSELHNRLARALVLLDQLEQAEAKVAGLRKEVASKEERKVREQAIAAEARKRSEKLAEELEKAGLGLEEVHRQNLAVSLRQGLKPGDNCPVCGREIALLPEPEHPILKEAEEAFETAQRAARSAAEAAQAASTRVELAVQALTIAREQLESAGQEHKSSVQAFQKLMPGQAPGRKALEATEREQQDARRQRLALDEESRSARKGCDELRQAIDPAKTARLQAEVERVQKELEVASAEATDSERQLSARAKDNAWQDVVDLLAAGADTLSLLKTRLQSVQLESDSLNRDIGRLEAEVRRIEGAIERAKELRKEHQNALQSASLARDLASLLRADRFQAFVREQALRILAEDGSRHLRELSSGRYDFSVEGQEFLIVDHWNGDEMRSVKTLSGGETFLASLGLALALAERLPQLGATTEGRTLESLFIDEGFSYLDEETLDVVASALEVLGANRERMVAVITHLPALAERMPCRITVIKSPSGSTLAVG